MVLDITEYPNSILNKISDKIENFDESLYKLLDDMNETMIAKKGIGLSAIQIAVPLQVFILNIPDEENDDEIIQDNLIEVINPQILDKKGSLIYEEGCLSIPEFNEEVKRAKRIKVKYQNRNGEIIENEFSDLTAVAFQHEFDHLKGKLFFERLSYLKRKKFEKNWKKKRK
jgi:peptide deformylase